MPSNLLTADTMFPDLTGRQSTDEKFVIVTDYLYMLLEQLRYTLSNLGPENFNSAELDGLTSMITEPIYARISDTEGNITALQVTAQGLIGRISDVEGNQTALGVTAQGLISRVSSVEGNVNTLSQTAAATTAQISDLYGNMSVLQQTATGLTSRISSAEGNISTLQQTATSLTSRIGSAEGDITSLEQTVNSFELSVSNSSGSSRLSLYADGVRLSSATITFTGAVTFEDLETEGTTLIHGGNIDTDTLEVSDLYGRYVYLRNSSGVACGRISISGATTAAMAVDIESEGALSLTAGYGDVYIGSGNYAYLQLASDGVVAGGDDLISNKSGVYSCGTSSHLWSNVYASTGIVQTSDRSRKHAIEALPDKYLRMLLEIPVYRFKMNDGTSDRYHVGYVAQDVEEYMDKHDIDSLEFAGFVKDVDEDGNEIYMLRYEEFVAIHTLAIQRIYQKLGENV